MSSRLSKVKIKVVNDRKDVFEWVHLCYIEENLYLRFLKKVGCTRKEFSAYISKWVNEEFNYKTLMLNSTDIVIIKKLIQDKYKRVYPHIYIESNSIDKQAWTRVWLTQKMEEELKYYE